MLTNILLAVHLCEIDLLLISALVRAARKNKLVQLRTYTYKNIDTVTTFFLILQSVLHYCYKVIDTLKANTGRPITDLHFQFNVFIFWKIFHPGPIHNVIELVNTTPELQTVLETQEKPYTESSFYRFKKKLTTKPVHAMVLAALTICFKEGIIKKTKVVIDSFPLYS